MATRILDRLYIGDFYDGEKYYEDKKNWICINVLEHGGNPFLGDKPVSRPHPILFKDKKGKYMLDWNAVFHITDLIEQKMITEPNKCIIIHCGAGQERSPLCVQYYLVRYANMSADQEYNFIKEKRPEIFRCDANYHW